MRKTFLLTTVAGLAAFNVQAAVDSAPARAQGAAALTVTSSTAPQRRT